MSENITLQIETASNELLDTNPVENGSQYYKCDQCTSIFQGKLLPLVWLNLAKRLRNLW